MRIRIPRTKRGIFAYIFAIAVTTFSLLATANTPATSRTANAPIPSSSSTSDVVLGAKDSISRVTRVIDGDTIEIESGEKVRLIGIDSPETVDPRRRDECFGKEASEYVKLRLEGQLVRLTQDVSNKDSFGRLLRYVYLEDAFINQELVQEGFAHARSYPPDIAHQEELMKAEREAFTSQKGLWGSLCSEPKVVSEN